MTNGHIVSIFERWQRLEEARVEAVADIKELFMEAKGGGYTPKALRQTFKIAVSKDDPKVKEHNALVDLYSAALAGDSE